MLDLCAPCKEKGKLRAVYKTVGGVPMCGGCVADREANPPEEKKPQALQFLEDVKNDKEEKGKSAMLDQKTIDAIKADESKLSLSEIVEKHQVSWPTAKRYAPNAVSKRGQKPAGGGDTSPGPKLLAPRQSKKGSVRGAHHSKNGASNGSGRFSDVVSRLREERDRIDRVIGELEQL